MVITSLVLSLLSSSQLQGEPQAVELNSPAKEADSSAPDGPAPEAAPRQVPVEGSSKPAEQGAGEQGQSATDPSATSEGNAVPSTDSAGGKASEQQKEQKEEVSVHAEPAPPPPAVAPAEQTENAGSDSAVVSLKKDEAVVQDTTVKEERKVKFDPGAQVFLRGFGRLNPDFDNSDGEHSSGVLERVRLQLRASYGMLSGYVEIQDARLWGFEASTVSNDANTDLHQGYMEFGGSHAPDKHGFIRIGRQEINWGSKRMIADLGWNPVARSFDALRLHGRHKIVEWDAFGAILNPVRDYVIPNDGQDPAAVETRHSKGGYLIGGQVNAYFHQAINVELSGLGVLQDENERMPTVSRKIGDVGTRLWGQPTKWLKYEGEGHLQFGEEGGLDHQAWAAAAYVQLIASKMKSKPSVLFRYTMASGERCSGTVAEGCGNTKSKEFYNFFPLNHAYYGIVDLFGWRNMRAAEVGMAMQPLKKLKLNLDYHFFQLNEADGRWSNAGGANVGAGWDPNNTENTLGHEIDFVATYKPMKILMVQPGYGIFIPTGAGKRLGGDSPQHFLYLWLVANF